MVALVLGQNNYSMVRRTGNLIIAYSKAKIISMEAHMLNRLKFDLTLESSRLDEISYPLTFMCRTIKVLQHS